MYKVSAKGQTYENFNWYQCQCFFSFKMIFSFLYQGTMYIFESLIFGMISRGPHNIEFTNVCRQMTECYFLLCTRQNRSHQIFHQERLHLFYHINQELVQQFCNIVTNLVFSFRYYLNDAITFFSSTGFHIDLQQHTSLLI